MCNVYKIKKFMSEFVVIQVGQCGNQIGSCLLPAILREYEIKVILEPSTRSKQEISELQQFISSFFSFSKLKSGSFETVQDLIESNGKARFLCIDMEDSVVARCRSGKFRELYDKKCLITNYPGSGNNWAEGYCSHGPKYKQKILKAVHHTVEQCDKLHGFILLFSVGGGTGSGLGTYIVKLLADYYPNIERFVVCVYPTGTEDVITCPYNMGFSTQELLKHATCVFPVENRALLDITFKQSNRFCDNYKYPSSFKPFEDMNSIIVDMVLHLTSGSRFGGKMNIDINEVNTNMVPFPKLNFLASGFSPIVYSNNRQYKNELFLAACNRSNQLLKIDPFDSRYTAMSLFLLGRGNYSISDMRSYIDKLKSKLRFPVWSNKAIKVGLCNVPPKCLEYSMFSLCNSSAINVFFQEINSQFVKLYQRKAHIHHYTAIENFDVAQFEECQNTLIDIVDCYRNVEKLKVSKSEK